MLKKKKSKKLLHLKYGMLHLLAWRNYFAPHILVCHQHFTNTCYQGIGLSFGIMLLVQDGVFGLRFTCTD